MNRYHGLGFGFCPMALIAATRGFRIDARAIIAYTDGPILGIVSDFHFDFRCPGMPKRVAMLRSVNLRNTETALEQRGLTLAQMPPDST